MANSTNLVNNTRSLISFTLVVFIAVSAFALFMRITQDTYSDWHLIRTLLGLFVIGSLYTAKNWAKYLVTFSCGVFSIFSFLPTISLFVNNNFYEGLAVGLLIIMAVYLIWFLNFSDTYHKYSQLIKSGFSHDVQGSIDVSDILNSKRMHDFDRKAFKDIDAYKSLTQSLLSTDELETPFENTSGEANTLTVETEDTAFEIELDKDAVFFDSGYISQINFILESFESEYFVSVVYPETLADKSRSQIGLINVEEYDRLVKVGMIDG